MKILICGLNEIFFIDVDLKVIIAKKYFGLIWKVKK